MIAKPLLPALVVPGAAAPPATTLPALVTPRMATSGTSGATPAVSAFDAGSLAALNSFFALPQGFTGGVFIGG